MSNSSDEGGAGSKFSQGSDDEHASSFSRSALAALWMVISGLLFVGTDTGIKHLGTELHPFEVAFFRNVFGLLFLLPIIVVKKFEPVRTSRPLMLLLRGLLGGLATLAFFVGIVYTPLVEAIAISFTAPIFGLVVFAVLGRAQIRMAQWAAVLSGLFGVLVILQPGANQLSYGALLILVASVVQGVIYVVVQDLTRTESSLTITIWMMLPITLVTGILMLPVWDAPTARQLLILAAIGVMASLAQYAMAQALRLGSAAVVLPNDFTKLIWASLIGVFWFGENLRFTALIGSFVIIGANAFLVFERTNRPRPSSDDKG